MGIKEKFNSILVSLGLKKENEEQEDNRVRPEDVVYNDNIQGEFFGVPFGATVEEVIEGFAKHNLFPTKDSTTDHIKFHGKLHENGISFDNLSFGGFSWNEVSVSFSNRCFYSIFFIEKYNDKEKAMYNWATVSEKLNNVYGMYGVKPLFQNNHVTECGLGKDGRRVTLDCSSFLTQAENIWTCVRLNYQDKNFYTENNEL